MDAIGDRLLRRRLFFNLDKVPVGGPGQTIEARILEGKGELLPGRPKGGGVKRVEPDHLAWLTDQAVRQLTQREQQIIDVYYDDRLTVQEKSTKLRLKVRTMYYQIDRLQRLIRITVLGGQGLQP